MFKLFVVQFLNSYATLYYVAFMKRDLEGCKNDHCVEDLSYRLILLLVTRIMLVLVSITRTGITNANKPLSHPPSPPRRRCRYKVLEKAVLPRFSVILRKARALMRAKELEYEGDDVGDTQMHLNPYDPVMETTIS